MNDLLLTVLSLSVSGTLVAAALFLLRPLLKNRISKTWQYYLWLLVIARLLLPISPEVSLTGSLFERAAPPPVRQESGLSVPPPETPFTEDGAFTPREASIPAEAGEGRAPGLADQTGLRLAGLGSLLIDRLWVVWLVGALFLLVKKLTSYRSFLHFIEAGRQAVSDQGVLDVYMTTAAELESRRLPKLYTHPLVSTPMQIGLLRPFIVLPEQIAGTEKLSYILRHELIHCRRLEFLYKWLVQLTVCVHWFNPAAYLVAREVDRACELACDEAVMRPFSREERKAYGTLLLTAASYTGGYSSEVVSVTLCENGKHLKERLNAILSYGKRPRVWIGVGAVLTACLLFGAGYLGAYTAAKSVLLSIAPPAMSVLPADALAGALGTPDSHTEKHMSGVKENGDWCGFDDDWYDSWYDGWAGFGDAWTDFGGRTDDNGYDGTVGEMRAQTDQTVSLEGVERLRFRLNGSDVTLLPSDSGDVRMVCQAEWEMGEDEKPVLLREGDALVLDTTKLRQPYVTTRYGQSAIRQDLRREILLYLPAGYEKSLEAVLNASDLTAKLPLRLSSCEVEANASDVTVQELTCGALQLDMNASDLTAARLTGAGVLRNNASDAVLRQLSLTGTFVIENNSADLTVEYARDAGFRFESSWSSSELNTDFSLNRQSGNDENYGSGTAVVNGGGELLKLRSSCGDADIRRAD